MSLKRNAPKRGRKKDGRTLNVGPSPENIEELIGLFKSGQLDAAETEARRLIDMHDEAPVLYNVLGSVLMGRGKLDEAVANFQRALNIDPNNAQAHNNLGNALAMQGRYAEATVSYQHALKIKPDLAQAHNNLGNALRSLDKLDEAIISLQRALNIDPTLVQAHINLGTALAAQGKYTDAKLSFRQAIGIKPGLAEAHKNLGNVLKSLGELDEAMASYKQALTYKPDNADIFYDMHKLLLDKEDVSSAIKCLKRAVSLQPQHLGYKFFLGTLLEYSGQAKDAETYLKEVEQGTDADRDRLDAWQYIKSAGPNMPKMIGSLRQAFRLGLESARVSGLVLEFGVRFGNTIRQIAGLTEQQVHGFDSFEGLPEAWHKEQKGTYTTHGVIPQVPDNVVLHKGWFEDTLPEFVKIHKDPVRFMNIDCDLYSATKTILDTLAAQIVPGTVIVFDEYVGNAHWREDEFKAFQEAVRSYGWKYEYLAFSLFTKQVIVRIL
jgi:tetratricopeptide (TPR) repeat protein